MEVGSFRALAGVVVSDRTIRSANPPLGAAVVLPA
jgi:hypothetical protein